MRDGKLLQDNMDKARVDEGEILMSARYTQVVGRLADIKHAAVEDDGRIPVVPRSQ